MKLVDLLGQQIGDWTVLRMSDSQKYGPPLRWECRCVCGQQRDVLAKSLRRRGSLGCGCRKYAEFAAKLTKHGHSKKGEESKTYQCWKHMIQRCSNPNADDYRYYGGRGISVCARWSEFVNFLADMGEVPHGLTIDRIDNNGPYTKANCRWATRREQVANKRGNFIKGQRGRRGSEAPWAKLTADQIKVVRNSTGLQRLIAERFKISQSMVSMIKSRKTWAEVA